MKIPDFKKRTIGIGLLGAGFITVSAYAAIAAFSNPEKLSENNLAAKTKLVRMGSGWLVAPYGDAVPGSSNVYDVKADATRLARDVFVKVCNPTQNLNNCSLASDWSAPVNLSNTALQTSISTDWQEDNAEGTITPYYGDSEKPNIFVAGSFAVVSWVDKYCEGGNQRMISYTERDGITVPFSCTYAAYTNDVASGVWTTQQLSDGIRDAKSDVNKGLSFTRLDVSPAFPVGQWIVGWQEDPHGLQIGGGDGPGDGASGASVTHGTDIWYTYTNNLMSTPWATPVRITDNFKEVGKGGNTSPVFLNTDPPTEIEELERGNTGSARPNFMLVAEGSAGSTTPTAVVAYEESKGADRTDSGKFVRYHEFAFNSPPTSSGVEPTGEPESGEAGCIISDPLENSRRVRFVAQPTASPNGLRMGVFWRQGFPTEGGPADIMSRVGIKTAVAGSTGLRPEDMVPAVDVACDAVDYAVAKDLNSTAGENLSSNTVPWSPIVCDVCDPVVALAVASTNDLSDATDLNAYEDARAHRAAIVGDDFYLGYSYTKDWALSTYSDLENYDFYLRHYDAIDGSWTVAQNVSNMSDKTLNVKEPRLVKTPGSSPACTAAVPDLEQCQNKSTLIVAWGTETNVYSHVQSSEELDIYYSRTTDKGATYEDVVVVPGFTDGINRFESQLRPSPAGNIIWTVWNEADAGGEHAVLSVSDGSGVIPTGPTAVNDTAEVACGSTVAIDVLGNDTGDMLAIENFTQPVVGIVTGVTGVNGDGVLTYDSAGIKCPIDDTDYTFDYTIVDADDATATATVLVTVLAETVTTGFDLSIDALNVPVSVKLSAWTNSSVTIANTGDNASGTLTVTGVDSLSNRIKTYTFNFVDLANGATQTFNFLWTTNYFTRVTGSTVNWTATVKPTPLVDDDDLSNDELSASTLIVR